MEGYIGLDAHASSCTLGVLWPGGKRRGSHVVETNAKALIEVLCSGRSAAPAGAALFRPNGAMVAKA